MIRNRIDHICLCLFVAFIVSSCGTTKQAYTKLADDGSIDSVLPEKEAVETLFLVGDAGLLHGGKNAVVEALKGDLDTTNNATLVYLGDNIYSYGLPSADSPDRNNAEEVLQAQLSAALHVDGDTYFIPGNHDWNHARVGGLERVRAQELFIESFYDKDSARKVRMYPSNGCGDPKVVKVHKDLVYVFIDTQWWLQDWEQEPTINHGCDIHARDQLLSRINEIFIEHKNDEIVLMMHHPMYSNGRHGGKFSVKDHLLPLTAINEKAVVPLPVLGSIYPLFRLVSGTRQDLQHKLYKRLMVSLRKMANSANASVIFASGHEHSMQLFEDGNLVQVVSGSGSKMSYAQRGGKATYVRSQLGYAKLSFYANNEVWVDYYQVSQDTDQARLDFRKQLRSPRPGSEVVVDDYPPLEQKQITVAADQNKLAGRFKRLTMGEQYRDIWMTPIDVPVINLDSVHGGLKPLKKGGGMSSNSLRLEASDGKQYILRSINKVFTRALPDDYKNLRIVDVIKDQNSAYHPYGSIVVTALSQAAGVYYTDPTVVFLKHQPALGSFNKYFPEELYMFEQRPDGDWSDSPLFGGSSKVISYNDLLVKLRTKKRHKVDQPWVLKSRMFDLFIHDWDRHDDQWRWASFKVDGETIYRPIPRDRDLAFYKFVGVIPWFISSAVITKYKTMRDDVKDVKSLTLNGKTFDRFFLNDLSWDEWVPVIQQLQDDLTDEAILTSGRGLPTSVVSLSNKELNNKLLARRDNLMEIGRRFYDLIATEVEVVGTEHDDTFSITYLDDGRVAVSYSIDSKQGAVNRFDRTFVPGETNEVRLYGLSGDDRFIITGEAGDIIVRVVGGSGEDMVISSSSKKTAFVYDVPGGVEINGKIRSEIDDSPDVNTYDRYAFKYNSTLVAPQLRINRDGLWFGGKYTRIYNGWRQEPYRYKHEVRFITAPAGQDAYRADYRGHLPRLLGDWGFSPYLNIDFPVNNNFFGYGNETTDDVTNRDFNWVRMNQINLLTSLSYDVGAARITAGPAFDSYYLYNRDRGILAEGTFSDENFSDRTFFAGATADLTIESVDNTHNATSGVKLNLATTYSQEISGDNQYFRLEAGLSLYVPLSRSPQITLASQTGFQWMAGSSYFFQRPFLGNNGGLRGVRGNRYVGDASFFENVDLRAKILSWNNVILPMDIGLLAGYDIGRVWLQGEQSDSWHDAKTIGIYLDVLGLLIVQPFYTRSEDGDQFSLLTRFSF